MPSSEPVLSLSLFADGKRRGGGGRGREGGEGSTDSPGSHRKSDEQVHIVSQTYSVSAGGPSPQLEGNLS